MSHLDLHGPPDRTPIYVILSEVIMPNHLVQYRNRREGK